MQRVDLGKSLLVDPNSRQPIPLTMANAKPQDLNLAIVSYKQYSQMKTVQNATKNEPIQPEYEALISKYPDILEVKFDKSPKHGVVHTIDTSNHPPCKSAVRPLMPNTEKAKQTEAT